MLKDGYYKSDILPASILVIEGNKCRQEKLAHIGVCTTNIISGTWSTGSFGPAHPAIQKLTRKSEYDIKLTMKKGTFQRLGVIGQDGKSFTTMGLYKDLEQMTWISEDDIKELQEAGDPAEAPPCPYKLNPDDHQGKLIWISGPPGVGKSTTAHLMSQLFGYVFYEGDCFLANTNPYVPKDIRPTDALFKQKPLKGLSRDRIEAAIKGSEFMMSLENGLDEEKAKIFYTEMAKDILKEKKRIGGNWVVSQAVLTKDCRDNISKTLKDVIHVTLNVEKDAQKNRLERRHGKGGLGKYLQLWYELYELADEKQENGFSIDVTVEMTPEDVAKAIIEKLNT